MWNWFNCYLSGRHDYGMWCEPGEIFLRCVHCGRRSCGWAVDPRAIKAPRPALVAPTVATAKPRVAPVLPFDRPVAVR